MIIMEMLFRSLVFWIENSYTYYNTLLFYKNADYYMMFLYFNKTEKDC